MRRLGRWPGLLAVLVLALVAGGIAVVGSRGPSEQPIATSPLAAAGLGLQTPEQPSTTVTTMPPTSTTEPPTTSTTAKVVPTTRPPAPPTVPTAPPTTTHVSPFPTVAPAAPGTNPSSWTLEDNGMSLRLRMEPQNPHVGDTVTFIMETSATVPTDYCCVVSLMVNSVERFSRFWPQGPCPLAPAPAEDRVSFVVTQATTLSVSLMATRSKICFAPPEGTVAHLYASAFVAN